MNEPASSGSIRPPATDPAVGAGLGTFMVRPETGGGWALVGWGVDVPARTLVVVETQSAAIDALVALKAKVE